MKVRHEILIIDDDIDVQALLKKILEGAGYSVALASSVDEGLSAIRNRIPHLVLLDIHVNQQSGFEVLAQRNKEEALKNTKILMLSATKDSKTITKALASGATDYIVKPFKTHYLLNKVKKILRAVKLTPLVLTDNEKTKVSGTLRGSVVLINELSCAVVSEAKIPDQTEIEIASEFLAELGLQGVGYKTIGDAFTVDSGNYKSEVLFLGVTERVSQKIRKKCRS